MTEKDPGQDQDSMKDHDLSSLDERLKAARHAEQVRTASTHKKAETGYSQGNRVLSQLIAGPAGGALMGWCFDHWFGTTPWLLLAMLFLGIGVAFRNIIRISQERPE